MEKKKRTKKNQEKEDTGQVKEKEKTGRMKDNSIDWEIPSNPNFKCDESPLPVLDPDRLEDICSIQNHRKERNKTGELLITFGSGETFWSTITKVKQDDDESLRKYLLEHDLTYEDLKKKRTVTKNITDNVLEQCQLKKVQRDTSNDPDKCYECRESHKTCMSFFSEGNSMYAAPNNKMYGKKCKTCNKQFVSSKHIDGDCVTPGKKFSIRIIQSSDMTIIVTFVILTYNLITTTDMIFRPTNKKPMWLCSIGFKHGCDYGLCNECFNALQLDLVNDEKLTRNKRIERKHK
jgi:hypothetical protein